MKKISEQVRKLCFQTRGQISMEYMIIVGITTFVAISLLAISHYYSRETEETINTQQIDRVAKEIVDTAESMYYYGEPSRTTVKAYLPDGIKEVTVGPDELSFRVITQSGETDMFYPSSVNLQGNISASYGYHHITIEAKEGYVWINST
ncbi:hypothetical protein KY361_01715 [Candidatus Woesearchaeota archaeon]|nr:hypothetical protein [Candidatus Woesearchaeota archaeon]